MKIATIHKNTMGEVVQPHEHAQAVQLTTPKGTRVLIEWDELANGFVVKADSGRLCVVGTYKHEFNLLVVD